MATRGRKKAETSKAVDDLLAAFKFVSVAQKESGDPDFTHSVVVDGCLVGRDGILTCGHPLEWNQSFGAPHTYKMLKALGAMGDSLSIVAKPGKLAFKSGSLTATVPCIEGESIPWSLPDPPVADLTDEIKRGFAACAPVADDKNDKVIFACVCLEANQMHVTNGNMGLSYWHGIDLPPDLLLPKPFVVAVMKSDKHLTRFGFSDNSVTFYFEDGSWIKTQRYMDAYPDLERVMNYPDALCLPLPEGFFEALDKVTPFADHDHVRFGENEMYVLDDEGSREASVDIKGVPTGMGFAARYLKAVKDHCTEFDFAVSLGNDKVYCEGARTRAAIMGLKPIVERAPVSNFKPRVPRETGSSNSKARFDELDDDIPF